jgi:hypothetical protein
MMAARGLELCARGPAQSHTNTSGEVQHVNVNTQQVNADTE